MRRGGGGVWFRKNLNLSDFRAMRYILYAKDFSWGICFFGERGKKSRWCLRLSCLTWRMWSGFSDGDFFVAEDVRGVGGARAGFCDGWKSL